MSSRQSIGSGIDRIQIRFYGRLVAKLKQATGKRRPLAYMYVSFGLMPVAVLLLLSLWSEGFNLFDINEQFYAGALAQLKEGKKLYRDFPFVQMPIMPWVYDFVLPDLGNDLSLQVEGKMLTFGFAVLNIFLVGWTSLAITRSSRVSMAIATLFGFSEIMFRTSWEFANYTLSATFWLLAFACFYEGFRRRILAIPFAAFAGLFLGWAVCTKLFLVVLILPFTYYALWIKRYPNYGALLGFLIGLGLGLVPALVEFIKGPEAFLLNNFHYHRIYNRFIAAQSEEQVSLLKRLFFLAGSHINKTDSFLVILALSYGVWVIKSKVFLQRLWKEQWLGWSLPLVSALVMFITLLSLGVVYAQYLIYLTLPLILSIASLYRWMPQIERPRFRKVLLLVAIFSGLHFLNVHAINWTFNRRNYEEAASQKCAENLKAVLEHKKSLKCASLLPGLAADAGLVTPAAFANSCFSFLTADSLTFDKQVRRGWVGPKRTYVYLSQEQPDVIILGWNWNETWIDKPFVAYAYINNYEFNTIPGYDADERLPVLTKPGLLNKKNPAALHTGFKNWLKEKGFLPDTLNPLSTATP